jgi:hypothetical protein
VQDHRHLGDGLFYLSEVGLISQIETWILSWLQSLFDTWGWAGVAGMM